MQRNEAALQLCSQNVAGCAYKLLLDFMSKHAQYEMYTFAGSQLQMFS